MNQVSDKPSEQREQADTTEQLSEFDKMNLRVRCLELSKDISGNMDVDSILKGAKKLLRFAQEGR